MIPHFQNKPNKIMRYSKMYIGDDSTTDYGKVLSFVELLYTAVVKKSRPWIVKNLEMISKVYFPGFHVLEQVNLRN